MKRLSTAADDIRLDRKLFSISGRLLPFLLLLVMLVTQTSARSLTANETTSTATAAEKKATIITTKSQISNADIEKVSQQKNDAIYSDADLTFDAGDEYADVDNIEFHHVKLVDGVMHEDHPIIMYKEDFVSEDYDPNKQNSNSNSELPNHQRRKYKNIKRQNRLNRTDEQTSIYSTAEKYHALKPEKIYFDILPQTPVVLNDDSSSNDSKFDPSRIRVEVISLLDEENDAAKSSKMPEDDENDPTKQLLNKRPKKYNNHHHQHQHQRMRRDLTALEKIESSARNEQNVHVLHKRNPHYVYERQSPNSFDVYTKHWNNQGQQKHPVAGNRWNGIDGDVPPIIEFDNRFGGEDNTDIVVWGRVDRRTTRRPNTTKKPFNQQPIFPPLFHNSNPEDADFSVFNNNNRRPQTNNRIPNNNNNNDNNRRPVSRPNEFTRPSPPPTVRTTSTRRPVTSTSNDVPISQCVWAIVNCCSTSNSNIRYECFERLGCRGAFWNLNPCADNVKDSVLDFVEQQVNKDNDYF